MNGVKQNRRHARLPAALAAGSFLYLVLITTLTSPVKDITWAIAFFVGLGVFLASVGYSAVYLQAGEMRPGYRFRITVITIFILVTLMFRSAQSLSWLDGLVLVIITAGLLFYSARRTTK